VYLLDTDICIFLLRGGHEELAERLREVPADELCTSTVTAAELRYGARHSPRPKKNVAAVEAFLAPLIRLPFDDLAALHFAEIKHDLARRGEPIGPMDLLVAAISRAASATLVTNNDGEFRRVVGLKVANWLAEAEQASAPPDA